MTSKDKYVAIIMTAQDCPPCEHLKKNGTLSQIEASLNSMGLKPTYIIKNKKSDPIDKKYPSGLESHLTWTPTIAIVPASQYGSGKVITEIEVYNQGTWDSTYNKLNVKHPISGYDPLSVSKWAKEVLSRGINYVAPTGAMAASASGLVGGAGSSKVPIGGANMCTVHKVKSSGTNNRKFW
ncbi:Hypothetical protein ORPV_1019 [Orpheovirus IHUMI-LCC2]|uniref:Uncharacterized protein n=1 Tax=Orpheovirus IHUMI-LCC2 TaxID=2023057 RepID=A0A2I2L5W2_9VIRU|nr:Hypothetical protein ORPV_1019 [Orpheovirus IHUMI-LCC2]SNW62923.1 Hypothetical protein ORPV_1019 [Orpheovirus IHUMI-LCC2]